MSTLPLPPKGTTNRELLSLARRIARYGIQRRELLRKVDELDGRIKETRRMFRALTDLIAGTDVSAGPPICCEFHRTGGPADVSCSELQKLTTVGYGQ